uniref:Butyrophilin subfamily 3 member A2-like Ig-C domain-containing protein n=1 Tax=Vombatus ursinus TaxID=29139 RepID=A0A4X2M877_VOMUR
HTSGAIRDMGSLFTVTVPKELYIADYGSNVTMECNFDTGGQVDIDALRKDLEIQSEHNERRMTLLEDQLSLRKALLHIRDVQIMDAGQYHCLLLYRDAADYKYVTLQVKASYKTINTQVIRVPGSNEMEFTCQSKGYPLAVVSWLNINESVNTTHSKTPEGLYNIISVLRLKENTHRNVSCEFWNEAAQERTSAIVNPILVKVKVDVFKLKFPESETRALSITPLRLLKKGFTIRLASFLYKSPWL